ncbi:MAG: STAS domain-containing protein [Marinilabiliaceae bacterium]|nr:STAS domain-containing protein [Marinilabiliaceae bacterium]
MVEVNKTAQGTVIAVTETNRITVTNANELKTAVVDAITKDKTNVMLDLKEIKYMDSTGISVLISGVKASRENNLNFELQNVQVEVMKLLKLMKIDKIIDIR